MDGLLARARALAEQADGSAPGGNMGALLTQANEIATEAASKLGLLGAGNATDGSSTSFDPASSVGGGNGLMGWLVGAAVVFVVLVPVLKLLAAGAAAVFLAGSFEEKDPESDEAEDDPLLQLVQRFAGVAPDALDGQRLKVTRLNDQLVAMQAAIMEQASGEAAGEALRSVARRARLASAWRGSLAVLSLSEEETRKVAEALSSYSRQEEERQAAFKEARREWYTCRASNNVLQALWHQFRLRSLINQQLSLQDQLIGALRQAVPKTALPRLRELFSARGNDLSWCAAVGSDQPAEAPPVVYVLDFDGDVSASRAELLAREVSAILAMPRRPAEVLLRLQSPGGTVTGYGLAAAQLTRLRAAGVRLVVCVDQLAASGGYLMASCADWILCSPFGAVGSIGVISQTPNFAGRLANEGFRFIQTTAGRWKTTLTPFQEPTVEQVEKVKEDIGLVYSQFAAWVKTNRPAIDVERVATGEVWYGPRALERGLVDELQTSGEYLLDCMTRRGCEVFQLSCREERRGVLAEALSGALRSAAAAAAPSAAGSLAGAALEGLLRRSGAAGAGANPALEGLLLDALRADPSKLRF